MELFIHFRASWDAQCTMEIWPVATPARGWRTYAIAAQCLPRPHYLGLHFNAPTSSRELELCGRAIEALKAARDHQAEVPDYAPDPHPLDQ